MILSLPVKGNSGAVTEKTLIFTVSTPILRELFQSPGEAHFEGMIYE
jgi:hypothetical protein